MNERSEITQRPTDAKQDPAYNGETPAYPSGTPEYPGLTKRELFAAMAMQGLVSNAEWEADHNVNQTAREAIEYADALLKELAK